MSVMLRKWLDGEGLGGGGSAGLLLLLLGLEGGAEVVREIHNSVHNIGK